MDRRDPDARTLVRISDARDLALLVESAAPTVRISDIRGARARDRRRDRRASDRNDPGFAASPGVTLPSP
jgi:hypothetical protein